MQRNLSAQTRGCDVLKLAALLCDLDGIVTGISPRTLQYIKKFPLARQEESSLSAIDGALRWLQCHKDRFDDRCLYTYFTRYGPASLDATVLLRAVDGPSAYPLAIAVMRKLSADKSPLVSPPQLITGREVAKLVGKRRQPSYRIGELQKALRSATALGDVRKRPQADAFAQGFIDALTKNSVVK